nr:HNH endonuclease [Cupriavidus gilardii]
MVAGSPDKGGYLQIFFAGKNHKAHRLAWLYMTGSWPSSNIDHINGVPWDNRWANLRDTPQSVNAQNLRRPRRDNKTGFLGVSPDRRRGGFIAQISANGRCRYLGRFPTPELAHQAYVQAKRQLHAGCTI